MARVRTTAPVGTTVMAVGADSQPSKIFERKSPDSGLFYFVRFAQDKWQAAPGKFLVWFM